MLREEHRELLTARTALSAKVNQLREAMMAAMLAREAVTQAEMAVADEARTSVSGNTI